MSTQGVGTFAINSFWESGRLIFYEKAYGHTTTGNVFILGADYVQVGDTANDINFLWYGDTTGTFALDAGAHTLTMTGLTLVATLPSPTSGTNNGFAISVTGGDVGPGTARAVVGSATTFTTMTSGNIVGVRGDVTMAGATSGASYLYGAQGKAITGANAFTGTALAGVYGQIDVTGGTITSGHVAAIQANIYGANSGTIPMEGIYVEHAGGGVINSLIQLFGKSTYVFDISSNTHDNVGVAGTVTTNAGYIKVNIDGSTKYIGLGDTVA